MKLKDYSGYTFTIKTDCSYWGDSFDKESALEESRRYGAMIEHEFPGISVRYCDLIGIGHADATKGPDEDVCLEIDEKAFALLSKP